MIRVGTFNLNNLFSRYNFQAEIDTIPSGNPGKVTLTFDSTGLKVRTFMGRLVKGKRLSDTKKSPNALPT